MTEQSNQIISIRDKAQEAVRNFKQSWVAVAQVITDIAYGGDYKEWPRASVGNRIDSVASSKSVAGESTPTSSNNEYYQSFEEYCELELGFSARQGKKLMRSYSYLKRNKPERLKAILAGENVPCPGYEIINDIEAAQGSAESSGSYDSNQLKEVEAKLFEGEISGRDASKEIREARITPGDVTPPDPTVKQMRKITTEYKRLCNEAKSNERIPDEIAEQMNEVLAQLLAIIGE